MFGSNKNVTELVITGNNTSARKAIGQITNDLDRAEREIGKMSRGWGNAIGAFGNVSPIYLAGGAALAAAGGFTALVAKTIEVGSELYKLSGRTGQSVETLSALQKISERSGISFDELLKLYAAGNVELEAMVGNLIKTGAVMSTQAAKDAAVFTGEMDKLQIVLTNLAVAVLPVLTEEFLKAKYMFENNSFWDILNPFKSESELLQGYDAWKKKLFETTEATNVQSKALEDYIKKLKELMNQRNNQERFVSRIEQQKKAKWGTRETNEFGLMAQPDNNLAIETLNGFQMRYVEMMDTRKALILEVSALEEANLAMLDGTASTAFGNMGAAANMFYEMSGQKSKEWFAIQKGFSIAQAVINTYEGATKALAQGGIFGPILAASVIAFGLAQVATIASQQPGGGVSGGSGGGYSAPSIPRDNEPRGGSNYNTTVIIYGQMNKDQYVRDLIPALEKAYRDGAGRRR